jgi:2',3'-cyclic-nucleotide 2'-phosphodiesterase (5'-nucleotidase family)
MKKGKKLLSLLLVAVFVFALCGTALAVGDKDIVVLYTNDVHCAVDDNIGYAGLAAYRTEMETSGSYVTLVDDGDALQGGVLGTLSKGAYLVDIMNDVGYDVIVPGNHEFDYGMDRFLELAALQNTDYVCCNFIDLRTGSPVFDSYRMITYGDVKVAYVGIDTPETFSKSTPTYFQDANGNYIYSFCEGNNGQDLYDAVQTAIDAAKAAGADYVVAVGHLGTDAQSAPWRSTDVIAHVSGLCAFIDGHSHSTIPEQDVADKDGKTVVLTSSGTKLAAIGKLVIAADGTVSSTLVTDYAEKDADVAAYVAGIRTENDTLLKTVVASTSVALTIKNADGTRAVRAKETNMGDLVADAYRIVGGADIGWVNGGGVRDSIPAGDITYEQIINVNPFGNALCVCEATGQEIIDALEMAARNCPTENGGFLQVSGLKYTIDTTIPSSVRIDDKGAFVSVDGTRRVSNVQVMDSETGVYAPIDLTKTYTLASHNYMLKSGGDGINMFKDNKFILEDVMLDNQVLITYITDTLKGVVPASYAEPAGRITLVTSPFADVVSADWFFGYVQSCYGRGVMNGMSNSSFEPYTVMTRAMFVTMLYRMENSPSVTGNASDVFADCDNGAWYAHAALWAYQNGIIEGLSEGNFGPNAQLTRQQMATIIYRYALYNGAAAVTEVSIDFSDAASVASWAQLGVTYCAAEGIMNGVGSGFDPAGTANRAMGAAVMSRIAA